MSYVWIFDILYVSKDCMLQMMDNKKHWYEIFMIVFCVLPVTSSLFLSIYLFRLTKQKRSAPVPLNSNQVDIKNKVGTLYLSPLVLSAQISCVYLCHHRLDLLLSTPLPYLQHLSDSFIRMESNQL